MAALGLYISVPFCRSKCSYCNFASGVFPASQQAGYVERVIADLRRWRSARHLTLPASLDSVYLGGGTPSILAPELMRLLFAAIRAEFDVEDGAEITLECAPGQVDDAFLETMMECGVNRVSFGVQSFVDREAAVTGRLHTRGVALRDVQRMLSAGIGDVNVDLIAGLPYQTQGSWRESLELLAESGATHASVYMLEVDEDSRLGRELLVGGGKYHAASVPDDDATAAMYLEAIGFLGSRGFAQYEISNFAQTGRESRHNLKYWQRDPYLGLGLDAHSMLRDADGRALRLKTADTLDAYMSGVEGEVSEKLTAEAEIEEAWFLGLRLRAGVDRAAVAREFGRDPASKYEAVVDGLVAEGLLERVGANARVRLTERGMLLGNEVFERFILGDGEKQAATTTSTITGSNQRADLVAIEI